MPIWQDIIKAVQRQCPRLYQCIFSTFSEGIWLSNSGEFNFFHSECLRTLIFGLLKKTLSSSCAFLLKSFLSGEKLLLCWQIQWFFFKTYGYFLCALKNDDCANSQWHHLTQACHQQQGVWADLPGAFAKGNIANYYEFPCCNQNSSGQNFAPLLSPLRHLWQVPYYCWFG